MMTRSIALALCLLYAGRTAVLAAVHCHESLPGPGAPCAACAWHCEGNADTPAVTEAVTRPAAPLLFISSNDPAWRELAQTVHSGRGPPASPL